MSNNRRDNVAYHGDDLRYGRAMGLVSEARSEDEEHAGEVIRTISRMRESLHNLPEQELYRLPKGIVASGTDCQLTVQRTIITRGTPLGQKQEEADIK